MACEPLTADKGERPKEDMLPVGDVCIVDYGWVSSP